MSKNKRKSSFNYSINDLCNMVNKFDKQFTIDIKKANTLNEPKQVFEIYLTSFQNYIVNIIYRLNGVKLSENFNMNQKIRYIDSDSFKEKSILLWNQENKIYNHKSYIFKCRFMSLFLKEYLDKLEKVSINRYKYTNNKPGKYENSYFQLKRITSDVRRFIKVMLAGNEYTNIILQVNQSCSFIKAKKNDPLKINKYIKDIKKELSIGLPTNICSSIKMPEDIAIDSVLKLAYMLVTGNTDLDALPKFKYIEGADVSYDLGLLIEALGDAIISSQIDNKNTILYRAYINASPAVFTKRDIENKSLSIGLYALSYTKFFCCDKSIESYINKMINSKDQDGNRFKDKISNIIRTVASI